MVPIRACNNSSLGHLNCYKFTTAKTMTEGVPCNDGKLLSGQTDLYGKAHIMRFHDRLLLRVEG